MAEMFHTRGVVHALSPEYYGLAPSRAPPATLPLRSAQPPGPAAASALPPRPAAASALAAAAPAAAAGAGAAGAGAAGLGADADAPPGEAAARDARRFSDWAKLEKDVLASRNGAVSVGDLWRLLEEVVAQADEHAAAVESAVAAPRSALKPTTATPAAARAASGFAALQ